MKKKQKITRTRSKDSSEFRNPLPFYPSNSISIKGNSPKRNFSPTHLKTIKEKRMHLKSAHHLDKNLGYLKQKNNYLRK
jgi:hypothetical protein